MYSAHSGALHKISNPGVVNSERLRWEEAAAVAVEAVEVAAAVGDGCYCVIVHSVS